MICVADHRLHFLNGSSVARTVNEKKQVWESSTAFIDAYRVGQLEAKSAVNFLNHIPHQVVQKLAALVRRWVSLGLLWSHCGSWTPALTNQGEL